MASRNDHDVEAAFRLSCKRWECPACAERKRQEWAERIFERLSRFGGPLHVWRGSPDRWQAIRKQVSRANGQYVSVRHGPESTELLALVTVPIGGFERMQPAEAWRAAVEAIREIPLAKGKHVSSSRGFLPPANKTRAWFDRGRIDATALELTERLQQESARNHHLTYDIVQHKVDRGYDWAAFWQFANAMTLDDRKRIRDRLFGNVLSMDELPELDMSLRASG
jgi:hypothetical protein